MTASVPLQPQRPGYSEGTAYAVTTRCRGFSCPFLTGGREPGKSEAQRHPFPVHGGPDYRKNPAKKPDVAAET